MTNRQTLELTIRQAGPADAAGIAHLVRDTFTRRYGAGDGEAALVEQLRRDGAVVVELIAFDGGDLVGHAMFSRARADPVVAVVAALGPVGVRHDVQARGVGAELIRHGLAQCREKGIDAVVVLGDPAYYGRFGFSTALASGIASPYAGPDFQALELRAAALAPVKAVAYPHAFARTVG